jgi:hypothetical protein
VCVTLSNHLLYARCTFYGVCAICFSVSTPLFLSLSLSRTHTHCSAALLFVSNKMIFIRSINESCLHSSCAENGALISRANGRETCGRRRQRVKNWPFSMAFNGVYKRAIYWHSTMHGLFFILIFTEFTM